MTDPIVAALLAPIDPARPAGWDVTHDDIYRRIADARRDEQPNLPRGIWVRDVKQADWGLVENLCRTTLIARSKDLRIACWLSEAWVHRQGFAGLTMALTLIDGLCTTYWPGLYPALEGDDPGARMMAIDWLNDRLPAALRQVPVVAHPTQPHVVYDWSDYQAAVHLEAVRSRDPGAAQKAEAGGATTVAAITACRDRTDSAMFGGIVDDLGAALAAIASLSDTLDAHGGRDAPSLGRIRDVATDIADFAAAALAERQTVLPPETPPALEEAAAPSTPAAAPMPTGPISRETAYRQLATIAAALRDSDPHSPVPGILDQVVGWRDLSLGEIDSALEDQGSNISMLLQVLGQFRYHG